MIEHMGITHYDLHADNVMVADTPYDVHVYKFGDSVIPIRTFGLAPVIIDFGMAYIPNSKYNATCVFSNEGYTTFTSHPIVDSRLLLMTAIKDLQELLGGMKCKTRKVFNFNQYAQSYIVIEQFIKKVKQIFSPLGLRHNGWYKKENMFTDIVQDTVASTAILTGH